jgi:hypothetical protein
LLAVLGAVDPLRSAPVDIWLTKPSLEICLTASSAEEAKKFFGEGIGLVLRPKTATGVPGMRLLLFSAGSSTVKVRVYDEKPRPLPAELAARNGLRLLTIPIERLDETVARLRQLGYEASEPREDRGTRWTLARTGDGTAVELVPAEAGAPRELELGLVVPDLGSAREFFTNIYGARELPEGTSRIMAEERELRFTTGGTVFKCWSPAGERPSDQERIPDVLGFRYVTHYVRDNQTLHDSFVARGIEIASPLVGFGRTASVFLVRGPGGALLEFVGPPLGNPPAAPFPAFTFETDYYAGRQPRGTALAAATEANALEIHDGKLYAVTSYMPESGRLADLNPKVLVKKSADGAWEIDFEAGPEFMRLGSLKSVRFTTDGEGNKLESPVSVLVAGTGAWRSQNPSGVVVFSRNDAAGEWVRSVLSTDVWNRERLNHATEVRCTFDHVDRVTGVHYVFAGSQTGRLFRGVYDPSEPGLIRWGPTPEIDNLLGNFLSAAEANGMQYVGVAYGPTEQGRLPSDRPVEDHGLFRRIDGPEARWEWVRVKEWEDARRPGRSLRTGQLRGLTAIPAPEGEGEVLLLAWDTVDSVIELIDPRDGHKATTELNVRDYLTQAMNRRVGVSSFAYNDMLPMLNPETGSDVHLIGLWVVDPAGEVNETGKSSWYLVRHSADRYSYGRIWDPRNPLAGSRYGLRGCRSIRPSPFPEEAGRVWHFAGFDQTGTVGAGATGPTAWIYKGELPGANRETIEEAQAYFAARRTAQPANSPVTTTPSLAAVASRLTQPDDFVVDDVLVGATDVGYFDPEFLSEVNRMVFQTSDHGVQQVWIAELNPLTGLLISATGKDVLVDTDVAAIGPQFDTTNGPEWGLDSEGAAIFYSKRDTSGVVQCWRASNLVPGGVEAAPLTHLTGPDGEGAIMVIARKDASRPTTQFIYRYIPAPRFRKGGPARWADETAPDAVNDFPQFNGSVAAPSWIEDTEDFVYAMLVAPGESEIAHFNTATGAATVLTSHPGTKHNVFAFKAPELNGELLVGSVIDRTRFTVFRSDGTHYAPWVDLVPPDPEHPYMISPEIFQAGEMTYFALQMCSHSPGSLGVLPRDVDCAMWILGLGEDASRRVAWRVDAGAVSGAKAYRFEPEVYAGAHEVFLFYNIGNTLHRARTGIRVATDSPAARKPVANPPPAATGASNSILSTATHGVAAGPAKGGVFAHQALVGSLPQRQRCGPGDEVLCPGHRVGRAQTGAKYGLRGCRSIRPSPFPEEAGRVWYFAGFDQTGAAGAGATGSAAWIYRGRLRAKPCANRPRWSVLRPAMAPPASPRPDRELH